MKMISAEGEKSAAHAAMYVCDCVVFAIEALDADAASLPDIYVYYIVCVCVSCI